MVNNREAEPINEKAKTSVWWDIDNCPIPKDCKPEGIAKKISTALHKLNYRGEISIYAAGNMNHIPPSVKQALSSNGIHLKHVNSRFGCEQVSKHLQYKRFSWTFKNRPPANLMFISRERTNYYNEERERGYNILIAHPPHPSDSLVASANTTWLWKSLLEEPDVTSRTFFFFFFFFDNSGESQTYGANPLGEVQPTDILSLRVCKWAKSKGPYPCGQVEI
ncbi:unnamed protein product [Arabidopsis halleri]